MKSSLIDLVMETAICENQKKMKLASHLNEK